MSKLWVSHLFRSNFHNKHSTYFGKDAQRCFDSMAEQREGTHLAWISPVRPSLIASSCSISLHIARCYELTQAQVFWMFVYKFTVYMYAWAISAFFWSRLLFCQPWQFVLTWGLLHLLSQSPDPQSETSTNFLLWSRLSTEVFQNFIVFQSAFASTFQFEDRNFSITPSTKCQSGAFKGRITTAATSSARKVSLSDAFAQLSQRQDTQLKSI